MEKNEKFCYDDFFSRLEKWKNMIWKVISINNKLTWCSGITSP